MTLNRNDIRAKNDLRLREVEVPEWGGSVFVRTLSVKQRDEFETFVASRHRSKVVDERGVLVKYVILAACDEKGAPMFVEDDAEWLADKSVIAVRRIADAASAHNGTGVDAVEDKVKN